MDTNAKCQYKIINGNTDIDDLSPSVNATLKIIAEEKGYVKPKIYKRTISADGGNYLGVLYEINITDDTSDGSKETNLFVKHVFEPSVDSFKLVSISEVFCKEIFVYRDLAKIFTKLQNEAHIPQSDRFRMVPSYNNENTYDAVILENITKHGFKTYGRMELMTEKYAKLCIQQLAKFHGLSFVIEKRLPIYFDHNIKSLKQSIIHDDNYKKFVKKISDVSTKKLASEVKDRIEKGWEKMLDKYIEYAKGINTSVKCLCHGDFKMNNIMYKEVEGDVKEVITVDYQLVHYGSPVIDFIFFNFIATDKKFRKNHLNEFKDLYHDSLKTFLEYFDIDVDSVYPRKTFERDFEDALITGLGYSIAFLPFLFTKEDETPDLSKDDIMTMRISLDEKFYEIFQGIVDDYIEWGYL